MTGRREASVVRAAGAPKSEGNKPAGVRHGGAGDPRTAEPERGREAHETPLAGGISLPPDPDEWHDTRDERKAARREAWSW